MVLEYMAVDFYRFKADRASRVEIAMKRDRVSAFSRGWDTENIDISKTPTVSRNDVTPISFEFAIDLRGASVLILAIKT